MKEEEGGGLSEINKYMKNTGSGKSLLKNFDTYYHPVVNRGALLCLTEHLPKPVGTKDNVVLLFAHFFFLSNSNFLFLVTTKHWL